jgi:hypothetical protein
MATILIVEASRWLDLLLILISIGVQTNQLQHFCFVPVWGFYSVVTHVQKKNAE